MQREVCYGFLACSPCILRFPLRSHDISLLTWSCWRFVVLSGCPSLKTPLFMYLMPCLCSMSMGKGNFVTTMYVGECIPLVCTGEDLYDLMERQANSECRDNDFTTCSMSICGTTYNYIPRAGPCSGMISGGGAAGLAICMLLVGGGIGVASLWWYNKKKAGPVYSSSGARLATSTAYTDI